MPALRTSMFFLLIFFGWVATTWPKCCFAIEVAPNSGCAPLCLDSPNGNASDAFASSTQVSDLTCYDAEYDLTATGRKFKSCVTCESHSTTVDDASGEHDLYWFLCELVKGQHPALRSWYNDDRL